MSPPSTTSTSTLHPPKSGPTLITRSFIYPFRPMSQLPTTPLPWDSLGLRHRLSRRVLHPSSADSMKNALIETLCERAFKPLRDILKIEQIYDIPTFGNIAFALISVMRIMSPEELREVGKGWVPELGAPREISLMVKRIGMGEGEVKGLVAEVRVMGSGERVTYVVGLMS